MLLPYSETIIVEAVLTGHIEHSETFILPMDPCY